MKTRNFSGRTLFILGFGLLLAAALSSSGCAPKYGCPINEETHVDFEKTKGKRGKSQLFDKKTTRRIKG